MLRLGLSAPLLFQYSEGSNFVAEVYRRGGWAAVDALYRTLQSQLIKSCILRSTSTTPRPRPRITLAGLRKNHGRMENG